MHQPRGMACAQYTLTTVPSPLSSSHLTQSPPIPVTSITCRMVGHLEGTVLSPGRHSVVRKEPHACNAVYLEIPLKFDS